MPREKRAAERVKIDVRDAGDYLMFRVHKDHAHSLRVSLEPCPCKATKSSETTRVRQVIADAIGKIAFRVR